MPRSVLTSYLLCCSAWSKKLPSASRANREHILALQSYQRSQVGSLLLNQVHFTFMMFLSLSSSPFPFCPTYLQQTCIQEPKFQNDQLQLENVFEDHLKKMSLKTKVPTPFRISNYEFVASFSAMTFMQLFRPHCSRENPKRRKRCVPLWEPLDVGQRSG